jgi:hypothetical protein
MDDVPFDKSDPLYAELERMEQAGTPDPEAFARVGADLVALFDDPVLRAEILSSVMHYAATAEAMAAFRRELAARGLTKGG